MQKGNGRAERETLQTAQRAATNPKHRYNLLQQVRAGSERTERSESGKWAIG